MNAKQLQDWLESRNASLHLRARAGMVYAIVQTHKFVSSVDGQEITDPDAELAWTRGVAMETVGPPEAHAQSNDLDEAVRLALLAFDLDTASSDDPNDLLDPNTFPCPECQRAVTSVRAARTETGWIIESAYGVGSLQACCRAPDLVFETEAEAKEFALLAERGAREAPQ